jgi:hypothetical protein
MNVQQFYGSHSENFNTIKTFMMKMETVLGSTYICKQALPVTNFKKKMHFVFGLMKNTSTFHYIFVLEVRKQIFISWQGTPDLRNPTKECNDSMHIPIH